MDEYEVRDVSIVLRWREEICLYQWNRKSLVAEPGVDLDVLSESLIDWMALWLIDWRTGKHGFTWRSWTTLWSSWVNWWNLSDHWRVCSVLLGYTPGWVLGVSCPILVDSQDPSSWRYVRKWHNCSIDYVRYCLRQSGSIHGPIRNVYRIFRDMSMLGELVAA